jgi:hypothetical protein
MLVRFRSWNLLQETRGSDPQKTAAHFHSVCDC